jgi:hypothetical protein
MASPGGDIFMYVAVASDPNCDGGELDMVISDWPSWCMVSADTVTGVADCDDVDTSFVIIVSDGDLSDTMEVSVIIDRSNVAPTIVQNYDTLYVGFSTEFSYYPEIIDPDDDEHTIWYPEFPHWCSLQNDSVVGEVPDTIFIEPLTVVAQDICNFDTSSFMVEIYLCGNANSDDMINVGDAVYLINHIFKEGPPPDPIEAGDANCDGTVNVGDPVFLINYVFKGGPPPCCPQ